MRFNIGDERYIIGFKINRADGSQIKNFSFMPPQPDNTLSHITIKKAVVVEHHKVPVNESDDKTADGYIFDVDGERGENQYPRASYGQTSDTMDYIVSTFRHHYDLMNKDIEVFKKSNMIVHYQILTSFLDTLTYGISRFNENGKPELAKKINAQYQQVLGEFHKMFPNKKIINKELVLENDHTGIFEHIITDL